VHRLEQLGTTAADPVTLAVRPPDVLPRVPLETGQRLLLVR
jgi:hypothetical protein